MYSALIAVLTPINLQPYLLPIHGWYSYFYKPSCHFWRLINSVKALTAKHFN